MVDWVLRNQYIEALENEIENDRKNHSELTYLSNIYTEFINYIKKGESIEELINKAKERYEYYSYRTYEEKDDNDCRKMVYDTIVNILT